MLDVVIRERPRYRLAVLAGGVLLALGCPGRTAPEPKIQLQPPPVSRSFAFQPSQGDTINCSEQANSLRAIEATKRQLFIEDCLRRIRVGTSLAAEAERLATAVFMLPEYHDEQRFVVDGGRRFGPMVFGYAQPNLWGFSQAWQIAEHGPPRGVLVALVVVDTLSGSGLPQEYDRLGLQAGTNCVFLLLRSGAQPSAVSSAVTRPDAPSAPRTPAAPAAPTFRAYVTHSAPGAPCDPRLPAPGPQHLAVTVDPLGGGFRPGEIPPVVRFSESDVGQPLIGVRCLVDWCEIGPQRVGGPPDFTPRATEVSGRLVNAADRREMRLKGYSDHQVLAVGEGATIRPSRIRATLVPEPGLDALDSAQFEGRWVLVATLHLLSDPANTSYAGWGLARGENKIDLTHDRDGWRMRVTDPTGRQTPWRNVARHRHHDAAVPGTARFRWTSYDDGIWIPCGQGCCRGDGGPT